MSEKIQVARASAIAGGSLALLKLGIGLLTGSLALISEGIHSTLDFLVTLATWMSVKSADVPADREHHYGHGKIENLTAFAQSLLLVVTAAWIVKQAVDHLRDHAANLAAEVAAGHAPNTFGGEWIAAILVVAVSLIVDLTRSRALARVAKKFRSQALEADALHFGTELVSSFAVLASLLLVRLGGEHFWLADPITAMFVALVMTITALRLGRRSADVLIDRAPPGLEEQVHALITSVAGVRDVTRVRVRQSGAQTFVDATIIADPEIALSAGHDISDNAELRVTEKFPEIDILIHVEPEPTHAAPAFVIRQSAEEMKIRLHAVRIREINGQLHINFHAELPPDMALAAAHERVDQLEEAIRQRLPAIAEITSHIEPAHGELTHE